MDQITHGIRSIFSIASVYNVFQRLLGARKARERYVRDFVFPFPGARILDIGCGTAPIIEHLPADIEYVGFDMNPNYISYAERKYRGRGTFFCARVNEASVRGINNFDIVLATAILHHLNDHEALELFSIAWQCLKQGGCLITLDNVYFDGQSAVARYIISKDRGQHVRTAEQYIALAKPRFTDIQSFVLHDMIRVPYTHFIMRCRKT